MVVWNCFSRTLTERQPHCRPRTCDSINCAPATADDAVHVHISPLKLSKILNNITIIIYYYNFKCLLVSLLVSLFACFVYTLFKQSERKYSTGKMRWFGLTTLLFTAVTVLVLCTFVQCAPVSSPEAVSFLYFYFLIFIYIY